MIFCYSVHGKIEVNDSLVEVEKQWEVMSGRLQKMQYM